MDRGDWMPDWLAPAPPADLESSRGSAQCNYELLRAFHKYVKPRRLQYTLAAGTLLGAMRNRPPGLLQWEHDVDVYMPASDASRLLRRLRRDCPPHGGRWRSRWCATLLFRDLVDRNGRACCGFGFKLFHRRRAVCELDVLVLGATDAPYMHGETPLWPPWGVPLAATWHALATTWLRATAPATTRRDDPGAAADPAAAHYVIPEDVWSKSLMADDGRWCRRAHGAWEWCGGPALAFFHAEYFAPHELLPTRTVAFHGLRLPVPNAPWALLNRTYGRDCAHVARLNEHRDAVADLRRLEHAHLRAPARVRQRAWWQT